MVAMKTHGKGKRKILDCKSASKDLPKDDDPFIHFSLPFIKDPCCLLQSGCYFAIHTSMALTPSFRTSSLI